MVDFIGKDLRGSKFERVDLSGARFRAVDLSGVAMRNVDLVNVDIEGQVDKILRGLGYPEPPLNLDDVRALLKLDRQYYSTTNTGWVAHGHQSPRDRDKTSCRTADLAPRGDHQVESSRALSS